MLPGSNRPTVQVPIGDYLRKNILENMLVASCQLPRRVAPNPTGMDRMVTIVNDGRYNILYNSATRTYRSNNFNLVYILTSRPNQNVLTKPYHNKKFQLVGVFNVPVSLVRFGVKCF
jgi:hypothetical protein